jgi:transketolase
MTVLIPADAEQMAGAIEAAYKLAGPVYIRGTRPPTWQLIKKGTPFEIGKIEVMREGKDLTVAACGIQVGQALLLSDKLSQEGVELEILNVSTVKPLDKEALIKSAKKTGKVVTMEDHQVEGGMGSAVAEVISELGTVPVTRIGLRSQFGETGEWEEVYKMRGLDLESVEREIKLVLD